MLIDFDLAVSLPYLPTRTEACILLILVHNVIALLFRIGCLGQGVDWKVARGNFLG